MDRFGINTEDLRPDELIGYQSLIQASEKNALSVEKIKSIIGLMRNSVEEELNKSHATPQNWVSLLTLFIPFVGIVRKWYQDQQILYLEARLRNLTLLYDVFVKSENTEKEIQRQVNNLKRAQTEAQVRDEEGRR